MLSKERIAELQVGYCWPTADVNQALADLDLLHAVREAAMHYRNLGTGMHTTGGIHEHALVMAKEVLDTGLAACDEAEKGTAMTPAGSQPSPQRLRSLESQIIESVGERIAALHAELQAARSFAESEAEDCRMMRDRLERVVEGHKQAREQNRASARQHVDDEKALARLHARNLELERPEYIWMMTKDLVEAREAQARRDEREWVRQQIAQFGTDKYVDQRTWSDLLAAITARGAADATEGGSDDK